jgi:NAD+ kinase
MAQILFVVHPEHPEALHIARDAEKWLAARGHRIVYVDPRSYHGSEHFDLAVSLGGDGTMLRTVGMSLATGMPVLGVNLGRLGYLTEVEVDGWKTALERFFDGDYRVAERMTLEVSVRQALPATSGSAVGKPLLALNDIAVEKTVPGHTIRVSTAISDRPFVTYAADGILVATPTGSTAYNLSVRGPILSPDLQAIVVTPVSPHMLFDRALVLAPEEILRLQIEHPRPAVLVVDGITSATLMPGDSLTCRRSSSPARLVTFGERDFHSILRARFHLADR